MRNGSKKIYHLEAWVVKVMSLYKVCPCVPGPSGLRLTWSFQHFFYNIDMSEFDWTIYCLGDSSSFNLTGVIFVPETWSWSDHRYLWSGFPVWGSFDLNLVLIVPFVLSFHIETFFLGILLKAQLEFALNLQWHRRVVLHFTIRSPSNVKSLEPVRHLAYRNTPHTLINPWHHVFRSYSSSMEARNSRSWTRVRVDVIFFMVKVIIMHSRLDVLCPPFSSQPQSRVVEELIVKMNLDSRVGIVGVIGRCVERGPTKR